MAFDDFVIAKVPFTYNGQDLERGEGFRLRGFLNDDKLRGLGYVVVSDVKREKFQKCDNCTKSFMTIYHLQSHKAKKGGCLGKAKDITNQELAKLAGKDPSTFRMPDDRPINAEDPNAFLTR